MGNKKITKALILAGGSGTRLSPLTLTTPKPVLPFINIPFIEHQIAALSRHGINEIILALSYKYESIVDTMIKMEYKYSVKFIFNVEQRMLGTSGPIALAKGYLDDDFFVLNADIYCEYPFGEIADAFFRGGKSSLLVVTQTDTPERFGVVVYNDELVVSRFVEKPVEYVGNKINAGIYVFSPSIFKFISDGAGSLERFVFPKLVRSNEMCVYEYQGYWMDVGTPEAYLRAQGMYLERKYPRPKKMVLYRVNESNPVTFRLKEEISQLNGDNLSGGSTCSPNNNFNVENQCILSLGVSFKKNVVIGKNVSIGKNTMLENCTVFDDTVVGNNVVIKNCIIGRNCIIGDGIELGSFSILGDFTKIQK